MPLYVPRYLDPDLLRDLLDYLDIEVPDATAVEESESDDRGRRLGIGVRVEAGVDRQRRVERREAFSRVARPGRLLSLAIEGSRGELIDLDTDPTAAVVQRSLVQSTGTLELSRASEIPQMLRPLLPMLLRRAEPVTGESPELTDAEAARLMFGDEESHPSVLTLDGPTDYNLAVVVRTQFLVAGNNIDDLEDELTIFGTVEKVLPEGRSAPLDRYVLPGLNRTLRRAAGDLSEMFAQFPGGAIERSDLELHGPGALVRAIAIFP